MDMNIATPPKKSLKTRPYNMDMNKEDHMTTLPKRDVKTRPYNMDMNERDLEKLSKSELIKLLLKQKKSKKIHLRTRFHSLLPYQKSLQDAFQKPTRKPPPPILQVEEKEHINDVPSSEIKELKRALKNHAKSYEIELQSYSKPFVQFFKTKALVESHLENLLKIMKGFKFIETLKVTFEKLKIDPKNEKPVSIYKTAFFNSKAKTITKVDDVEPKLRMSRDEILDKIDKWVSKGSGWIIDLIKSHYINVTLYKPLNGSSYVELPTELQNSAKGIINMKNEDDECFRWCHIRHLSPQTKHPERIKQGDKRLIEGLNSL